MFDNSKDNPYIIDDEDVHHDHRVAAVKHEFQQFGDWWQPSDRTHRGTQDELSIELEVEDRLVDEIAEVIDLTDDVDPTPTIRSREGMRSGLERELPSFTLNDGLLIRPGLSFEIKNPETAGMAFFKVISVVQRFSFDGSSQTFLRGWGFARTRRLQGELPRKQNELFLFSNMENGCSDSWERQSLTDISPTAVKKVRDLRITNSEFPEFRFTAESFHAHGKGWVDENGPLVCRYRREAWFNPGSQVPTETALVRITEAEADPNYRWEDAHLVNRWRGGKVPGGSHPHGLVLDVDKHQEHHPAKLQPGQKYTAGDIFAGAGGASRGIERAGLRLLFSLDHWGPAANSLRMNFSKTDVHECEVTDFILNKDIRYEVDILHLSPPCQFWSPAHTTAGKDDEQNIDVLFSCEHLIKKLRPRLFTVEQTFGIIHARFSQYFAMLIHGFTAHGYSVRWKVVVLANYGVPQSRKRLIMIGAGPGERLPPFPPPTHSKGGGGGGAGGLPRWVTPRAALAKVRHITAEENKQHVKKRFDVPKPAWDPSRMAKTITCGGGQNYHWNGTRDFTKLEYAVLQGFPTWHKFSDVAVKKQIGNAFAPSVVRIFYRHLVRWLLRHDGFDPAEIERASASASANNLVASTAAAATRRIRIRDDVEMIDLDGDDDDDDDDDNNNNNNDQDGNGNLDKQQDDQTKKDDGDELIFLRARGVGKGNSIIVNNPEEVMEIDSDGGGGDDDNDDEDYSYPSSDSSGTLVMSDDDDDDDNDEVVDVEIPEELLWII